MTWREMYAEQEEELDALAARCRRQLNAAKAEAEELRRLLSASDAALEKIRQILLEHKDCEISCDVLLLIGEVCDAAE